MTSFQSAMTTSKRTFRMFVEEELGEFPHFLVWAVLEWMLIISLYLDGFLAFFSNKFADTFELDPPCVLCTRVDHVLGGKNPNSYYNESICESHKKDISSLAYCHVHRKLADIRNMCDGCLLSFAIEKESDSDENKPEDVRKTSVKTDHKVKDGDGNNDETDMVKCSCCGEPLKQKQASKELSRSFSNLRSSQYLTSSPRASSLFTTSSPRASSLFPGSSPRASSLFPNASPRASSTLSSLFPGSSPRANSTFAALFPGSSPRASSSLFSTSSPRVSSLFSGSSPRVSSSLMPSSSPRTFSSLAPVASPRASWRIEEGRNADTSQTRYSELKFVNPNEPDMGDDEYGSNANAKHSEEESGKTPSFAKGNKFFGIPLTESTASPRWAANKPPKRSPIDKSDLFQESVEDPLANNATMVQQLKKQISDNRKTLITLYMELDEERSAAAVAANNAMAMITRLQAEKAGVQMEALQYQRMMDEQAEYDEEAIQILRDLYLKKEDDVKVLEAEVDAYRERYGELKKFEYDPDADDYYDEFQPRSFSSFGERSECGSLSGEGYRKESHEDTSFNFENERCQLFGMLKDLENHVRSSSQEEDFEDKPIGKGNNAMLRREVSLMREKLAAIEAESGFLKQTAMTLEKGEEGTKLLTEIAEHLRNLPSPNNTNPIVA